MSFQPVAGPPKGTRFSLRLQQRAETSQGSSIAGQPYHHTSLLTRGRTIEPNPTAPRSPSAPTRRRPPVSTNLPLARRARSVSTSEQPPARQNQTVPTAFTIPPHRSESISTAVPQQRSRLSHQPVAAIHYASAERPSARVHIPGGIEDISVNLPEPPVTAPLEDDLFRDNETHPPHTFRLHGINLLSNEDNDSNPGEIILPETFEPGHAITPNSPLSPVQEEASPRRQYSPADSLPPAQRRRSPPPRNYTPFIPPTGSQPTMTTGQPVPAFHQPPTSLPQHAPATTHIAGAPLPGAAIPPVAAAALPPLPDLSDPDTHPISGPNPAVPGATMPYPGDRRAPKFNASGDPAEIPIFFDRVRLYGRSAGLSDAQMIAWARCYADAKDDQLWCKRPETRGNDFAAFRTAILQYYPNATTRYTLGDLYNLTTTSRNQIMLNTAALGEYHRTFISISSYLIDAGMLSEFEQKRMFREGLHHALNKELDLNLKFVQHDHPVGVPWEIDTVVRELGRILTAGHLTTTDQPLTYSAGATLMPYTHIAAYTSTPQPGAPAYGVINQNIVKQEDPVVSLLIQEIRALREATERSSRQPQTFAGPAQPQRFAAPRENKCAICSSMSHFTRECPTKAHLIQKGIMMADAKGRLHPKEGFLPRGEPGMSVLDRINKMFMDNPNYAPIGTKLPIQPLPDIPPRIAGPRQETMYQSRHMPSPHQANLYEAVGDVMEEDDDPCTGVAALFHNDPVAEEAQQSLANAGRHNGPRMVLDGVVLPKRGPPGPRRKRPEDKPTKESSGETREVREQPIDQQVPTTPDDTQIAGPTDADDNKPQYKTKLPAYDDAAVAAVFGKILTSEVTLPIKSLFAASPEIRKKCKEFLTPKRELIKESSGHEMAMYASLPRPSSPVAHDEVESSVAPGNVPLREVEVWLDGKLEVKALLDSGSTFIAMPKDIWRNLGSPAILSQAITVETADSQLSRSAGLIPRVRLTIGSFSVVLQVQVVEQAPFQLLLGRPFFVHTRAQVVDESDDEQILYLTHPDTNETVSIPTIRRTSGSDRQRPAKQ